MSHVGTVWLGRHQKEVTIVCLLVVQVVVHLADTLAVALILVLRVPVAVRASVLLLEVLCVWGDVVVAVRARVSVLVFVFEPRSQGGIGRASMRPDV